MTWFKMPDHAFCTIYIAVLIVATGPYLYFERRIQDPAVRAILRRKFLAAVVFGIVLAALLAFKVAGS
jgi:hypothetical protein